MSEWIARGRVSNLYVAYRVCAVRPAWEPTTTLYACLPFLSGYTSRGGGRVKGQVTPEVIGRSGQRAAIVNESHRSHQMLTFDWRRAVGRVLCATVMTPGGRAACRPASHVTASACHRWHFPPQHCRPSSKQLLSAAARFFSSPPTSLLHMAYAKPD